MTDNRIPTIMNQMWDIRYQVKEYVYGKLPNDYFRQELECLNPGKVLLPGEGEGRNAVFAAASGWDVTAYDSSIEGKRKAIRLSAEKNVKINYLLESYQSFNGEENSFDLLGLFFTHLPSEQRSVFHQGLFRLLKPGGTLLLEAFHKNQLKRSTGGPKNIDMLYSEEELRSDFSAFKIEQLEVLTRNLNEGSFHQGEADVIQLRARKEL